MFLNELSPISGVSGDEKRVREFIKKTIKDKVDELYEDKIGNLIALKKSKFSSTKGKFAFFAHMDEVGFMVTKINEDGKLSIQPIGGVDPRLLPGKRLRIGDKNILGVIGFKAIHLQENKTDVPKYQNLSVDIGMGKKSEAEKLVNVGDYAVFDVPFEEYDSHLIGKAFDDRGGCSLMMDLIFENLALPFDVYFAFVVQEEVGLRGSGIAAEEIKPDVAIVLETTTAGDNPELEEYRWATHIGDGPAITFMHRGYVVNKKVYDWIINTAERKNVKYQYKRRTAGGTDALSIAKRLSGIPAGVISIPCRYIHGPSSVMFKDDYHITLKLLKVLLEEGEVILS
ncbi:MAG TPA: M42 family peptidase [Thermotogaceae bacterium]|nr:M42 family peptidase [Thermotogaceae bacterium]